MDRNFKYQFAYNGENHKAFFKPCSHFLILTGHIRPHFSLQDVRFRWIDKFKLVASDRGQFAIADSADVPGAYFERPRSFAIPV